MKTTEIRNIAKPKEKTIETNKIEGKKVIDSQGNVVGQVKAVHVDPITLYVEGITIDKGLFNGKDYISSEYISALTDQAAMLTIVPISQYVGKKVFDANGKEVGTVKEIYRTRKTNSVLSITVDRGLSQDDLIITDNVIDNVGSNITLNEPVEA